MTTAIDIIDTAVKIGLGALISGLTGYWVMKEKNKHELKKIETLDKKEVLKDIALKVEISSGLLAEFVHHSYSQNGLEKLEKNTNKLIEASNISGNAAALENMIGFSTLASSLESYHLDVLGFHDFIAGNVMNIAQEGTAEFIGKINSHLDKIKPLLANAYEEINA